MDLEEIKRGLRGEIKKRESEQYCTCETNIRQMCKDVLAKLEEQESAIAEKDAIIEEQAKEIKFMHQHCKLGEHCGTSCAQIHGELMRATAEIAELKKEIQDKLNRSVGQGKTTWK